MLHIVSIYSIPNTVQKRHYSKMNRKLFLTHTIGKVLDKCTVATMGVALISSQLGLLTLFCVLSPSMCLAVQ